MKSVIGFGSSVADVSVAFSTRHRRALATRMFLPWVKYGKYFADRVAEKLVVGSSRVTKACHAFAKSCLIFSNSNSKRADASGLPALDDVNSVAR